MYELMVLGQLARCPMHGYMIAKIIGDIIGPFRRVQWGALYPLLNRLEQKGLIRTVESPTGGDGRGRKVYAITETGRRRLHEHLMDTELHAGDYDSVFAYKVSLFSELTPQERLWLAQHYAVYAQQNIDHLRRERRDLVAKEFSLLTPNQLHNILAVMDHRLAYWRHERAWAEELIDQNRAPEPAPAGGEPGRPEERDDKEAS
jgi:DNA-binding PadR family transcriptional regulator